MFPLRLPRCGQPRHVAPHTCSTIHHLRLSRGVGMSQRSDGFEEWHQWHTRVRWRPIAHVHAAHAKRWYL